VRVLRVRVFYHDKCFDGACSASLFTRFHRERIDSGAAYEFHGLVHRAGALFDEAEFTGDENAIVDFKYSASPRITWWFDHHQSAFLTPQDHAHFRACQQDPVCAARKFFDPTYISCTGFLGHIAATKFGFDTAPVAELIHWANIVDGALYESPEAAVEMAEPAMKTRLLISSTRPRKSSPGGLIITSPHFSRSKTKPIFFRTSRAASFSIRSANHALSSLPTWPGPSLVSRLIP